MHLTPAASPDGTTTFGGTLNKSHWESVPSPLTDPNPGGVDRSLNTNCPTCQDLRALLAQAALQADGLSNTLRSAASAVAAETLPGSGEDAEASAALMRPVNSPSQLSRRLRKGSGLMSWGRERSGTFGYPRASEMSRPLFEVMRRQRMPQYTRETLPEVEVTLTVHMLADLRPEQNQFFGDVGVQLEWLDMALGRDEHYAEDYRTQQLKLFPSVEQYIFNPVVQWDNCAKYRLQPGADEIPCIEAEVPGGGVWMRKAMRYHGNFSCSESTYEKFPYDHHALPMCLTSLKWQSLGAPKLKFPTRERFAAVECGAQKVAESASGHTHVVKKNRVHLGELVYVGYGVRCFQDVDRQERVDDSISEFNVFVHRSTFKHLFDFLVLLIMVCVSSISFCCNLNDDALAGRLSITLTTLLSLIAFTAQRPSAIQMVPYSTVFDRFAQLCVVMVAIMSLCNVSTIHLCFEVEPFQECSLCLNVDLELCGRGFLGYTSLDDYFLIFFAGALLLYLLWQQLGLISEQRIARETWRRLCEDPDAYGVDRDASMSISSEVASTGRLAKAIQKISFAGRFLQRPSRRFSKTTGEFELRNIPSSRSAGTASTDGTVVVHVLDLGGGEVGFYRYTHNQRLGSRAFTAASGSKLKISASRLCSAVMGTLGSASDAVVADLGAEIRRYLLQVMAGLEPDSLPVERMMSTNSSVIDTTTPTLFVGITGQLQRDLSAITKGIASEDADSTSMPEPRKQAVARLVALLRSLEVDVDGDCVDGLGRTSSTSEKSLLWRVRPFLLPPERVAAFERKSIAWLVDHGDLGLVEAFSGEPKLQPYLRSQVSSWVMLHGKSKTGLLTKAEFVEMFLPLSSETTLEDCLEETNHWFEELTLCMPADSHSEQIMVTVEQVLELIVGHEYLLQAVIRHRLFVGSLAGSIASFHLTIADPQNQRRDAVRFYAAPFGNLSPVTGHGLSDERPLFQPGKRVSEKELAQWQAKIAEVLNGVSAYARQWPRQRRGIFVGIASMFYAAQAAGIYGRFVSKRTALEAFGRTLRQELTSGGSSDLLALAEHLPGSAGEVNVETYMGTRAEAHQQLVANLAIAHALIDYVLHEDAWVYFRREWTLAPAEHGIEPCKAVATWSLGWFLAGVFGDGSLDDGCDCEGQVVSPRNSASTHFEPDEGETACCCLSICAIEQCLRRMCGCCRRRNANQSKQDARMLLGASASMDEDKTSESKDM